MNRIDELNKVLDEKNPELYDVFIDRDNGKGVQKLNKKPMSQSEAEDMMDEVKKSGIKYVSMDMKLAK